jgi:hypothetical protein
MILATFPYHLPILLIVFGTIIYFAFLKEKIRVTERKLKRSDKDYHILLERHIETLNRVSQLESQVKNQGIPIEMDLQEYGKTLTKGCFEYEIRLFMDGMQEGYKYCLVKHSENKYTQDDMKKAYKLGVAYEKTGINHFPSLLK